jgi:hypothetical protein
MTEFKTSYWDETTPSGSSEVRQTDEEFVSLKSSLRSIIGEEHEFNTAAADHVRGTHKQGSARAWVDVESNFSQSGTSYVGRLYATSDTSRLFLVPDSGFTMFLGGSLVPEIASYISGEGTPAAHYPGQNARWVIQCGVVTTLASGSTDITFSPTYSNAPIVMATPQNPSVDASAYNITTSGCSIGGGNTNPIAWMSMGTVDF